MDDQYRISSVAALREIFPPPSVGAASKQIDHLDEHCRNFLAHCPFLAMGTTNPDGSGDVSPKGGPAGFIAVLDDHHLAWGELPGNNRIDGYSNIVRDPRAGLLCMVPGIGETMRINGTAWVTTNPELLSRTAIGGKQPKVGVVVRATEAFIHCAKAIRRSSLWSPDGWPDTSTMTKIACMFVDHTKMRDVDPAAIEASLERDYERTLWNK